MTWWPARPGRSRSRPPTWAAWRAGGLVTLNVLTPMELSRQVPPGMVARGKRHVRHPRRALTCPLPAEAPRRLTEIIVSGVPPR